MKPVELSRELEGELISVAGERGISFARDTHYDAFNLELQWWKGDQFHRVDFQPCPDGHVTVTSIVDTYPMLGPILQWARNNIPFFPHIADTRSVVLGKLDSQHGGGPLRNEIKAYVDQVELPVR